MSLAEHLRDCYLCAAHRFVQRTMQVCGECGRHFCGSHGFIISGRCTPCWKDDQQRIAV